MPRRILRHLEQCTRHDPQQFLPFLIQGQRLGDVRRDHAGLLGTCSGFHGNESAVTLLPETKEERTAALRDAAHRLSDHFGVPLVGEIYPVVQDWETESFAEIDRAAIPWFGTRGFGVHINGYVRTAEGLSLWVARRAADRRIDPGKLDNMIGGGLPLGYTVEENVRKEAWEEAGLSAEIAAQAKPAGRLNYKVDMMKGVRNDSLFLFDLELPQGLIPRNTDGEVESFTLMPAAEVAAIIEQTNDFKFNCNLVMIDFLLRHNLFPTDHPALPDLKSGMDKIRQSP